MSSSHSVGCLGYSSVGRILVVVLETVLLLCRGVLRRVVRVAFATPQVTPPVVIVVGSVEVVGQFIEVLGVWPFTHNPSPAPGPWWGLGMV